jgi:predicted DNA-binding transcriptional regulator YafY
MRRADRLFDILQALRVATRPVTAAALAEQLEVAPRTVYRDIATLQARRIPIEGAAGVGYVLRRGFDLPPLMFTDDEIDAIVVGVRMLRRLRDPGLERAADSILAKVTTALPDALRSGITTAPLFVSDGDAVSPQGVDLSALRQAIRNSRKVRLCYVDTAQRRSDRTIRPIAMAYYVDVSVLAAWCELREDFRHFRVDRIVASAVLDECFSTERNGLMQRWFEQQWQTSPLFRSAGPNGGR